MADLETRIANIARPSVSIAAKGGAPALILYESAADVLDLIRETVDGEDEMWGTAPVLFASVEVPEEEEDEDEGEEDEEDPDPIDEGEDQQEGVAPLYGIEDVEPVRETDAPAVVLPTYTPEQKKRLLGRFPSEAIVYAMATVLGPRWYEYEHEVLLETVAEAGFILDPGGVGKLMSVHAILRCPNGGSGFHKLPSHFAFHACCMSNRPVRFGDGTSKPTAHEVSMARIIVMDIRPDAYEENVLRYQTAVCIDEGLWCVTDELSDLTPFMLEVAQATGKDHVINPAGFAKIIGIVEQALGRGTWAEVEEKVLRNIEQDLRSYSFDPVTTDDFSKAIKHMPRETDTMTVYDAQAWRVLRHRAGVDRAILYGDNVRARMWKVLSGFMRSPAP
jgi:hypothetical protein